MANDLHPPVPTGMLMQIARVALLLLMTSVPLFVACGGDSNSPTSPSPSSRVNAVIVTGTAPAVGAVAQFSATAALLDGSSRPVTAEAAWESSNTAVARVERGIVTGVAAGETDIMAQYRKATGRIHITVATVPCTYTVSPTTATISGAGGTVRISVFAGASCGWTTSGSSSFVTMTAGESGTGNGATTFVVAPNAGDARTAVFTIAGREVTISQGAGNCVTAVSPATIDYSAELKRGTVTVTAAPGCVWTATSSSPSLSLISGMSGSGNGSIMYRVFGNITGAPRTASIQVLQQTVTVTQQPSRGGNVLSFVSDSGDSIGQGWTLLLEAPTSTFAPTQQTTPNHIRLNVVGSDGLNTLSWTLDLAAPQGAQLAPGTYVNATRYPVQAPTVPGLNFSTDGRSCSALSGQFSIREVAFSGDGSLQRLNAMFEQHCEGVGPALRGTIVYAR